MRDWFTKDFGWKLFSVILAVAIWLTIHKNRDESGTRNPLTAETTYDNLPVLLVSETADVHDFRAMPATVSVKVKGAPDVMAILQGNQIHATVDLTGIDPAKDSRRHVDVATPPGVTVANVEPTSIGIIAPPKKQ